VNDLTEALRRIGRARGWVAAQYWATVLIALAGIAWTRLPDKHAWQVGLTLLIPLVLLEAFLLLEAGTMRKLMHDESGRAGLVHGALTLLFWITIVCAAWAILDWCDDQSFLWASYLNSKSPANLRGRILTYQHIELWITTLIWIFKWIALPAKVIPHAVASAQWGWRLPWRKSLRLVLNWRWWSAVAVAALVGVALPGRFFKPEPSGSVSHQVWAVGIKLAGAYLLAITSWVLVLAWAAVLLGLETQFDAEELVENLFACLRSSRKWILGWVGWIALSWLFDFIMDALPEKINTNGWVIAPFAIVMMIAALVLQVGLIRAMTLREEKQVRPIWAALSVLAWLALSVGLWVLAYYWNRVIAVWIIDWIIVPALLIPFTAASSRWGFKLPWRRVVAFTWSWRWWTGIVFAVILGAGLPELIKAFGTDDKTLRQGFVSTFWSDIPDLLTMITWILLMGWFAVLMAGTGPAPEGAANSPLPESGDNAGGNA
jgi:hypothetical protein